MIFVIRPEQKDLRAVRQEGPLLALEDVLGVGGVQGFLPLARCRLVECGQLRFRQVAAARDGAHGVDLIHESGLVGRDVEGQEVEQELVGDVAGVPVGRDRVVAKFRDGGPHARGDAEQHVDDARGFHLEGRQVVPETPRLIHHEEGVEGRIR